MIEVEDSKKKSTPSGSMQQYIFHQVQKKWKKVSNFIGSFQNKEKLLTYFLTTAIIKFVMIFRTHIFFFFSIKKYGSEMQFEECKLIYYSGSVWDENILEMLLLNHIH